MTWAIYGAGAQGRITADILREQCPAEQLVLVDDDAGLVGREVNGVRVVAPDWLFDHAEEPGLRAVIAVGRNRVRLRLAEELGRRKVTFGNVIHPSVRVLSSAVLGRGVVLCPQAIVATGAKIGDHALINTAAVVEHDAEIGEGASISTGAIVGGRVRIGRGAFLGTRATVLLRLTVGGGAIVGAGALVTHDVQAGVLAYGSPARPVRDVDLERDWARLL